MAMANEEYCRSTQLIDGNGVFNFAGFESFMQSVKLESGASFYAVVAIMGPQGSGKSTLLNNLFGTKLAEMDAQTDRNQTTKGIWMAKAVGVEPLTIVLDIEGYDGQQNWEDDSFEKHALFALAVADVVLINIWGTDISRETGASLRTLFEVMADLFTTPRKTTLLFVIRDQTQIPPNQSTIRLKKEILQIWSGVPKPEAQKNAALSDFLKTPLNILKTNLIKATQKIWMGVPKPEARKNADLSDFVTVEVTTLPPYEREHFKEQALSIQRQEQKVGPSKAQSSTRLNQNFKNEVAQLRKRLCILIGSSGHANVVGAQTFYETWKLITDNHKDLALHKVSIEYNSTQLIYENGKFNHPGLNRFIKSVKLAERGVCYAVVAIMGPQSSGKSTLLNNLFRTDFVEMNALEGRSQTTKGIWMAKAVDVEPLTIVLDIEGNDGQERGKDQAFEKQSALFALAVADVVLINMWCIEVGREAGAGKPLLRTVFQVMAQLFTPRKTTLLFVLRDLDQTETPLDKLKQALLEATQKIWMEVPKPEARKNAALSDFFNVEVTALHSYRKQEFKGEVAQLKKWLQNSIAPGGLAGDRRGVVEASGFSYSAEKMWKDIRENKDLDLPAHKVTVDNFRCDEIVKEISDGFRTYKHWLEMEAAAKSGPVSNFGEKLSLILKTFLSKYDKETEFFDEGVRDNKRKTLESNLLRVVRPAYETLLGHLISNATERFKTQLEITLRSGKGFEESIHECSASCMLEFEKELQCAGAAIQQSDWSNASNISVTEKLSSKIKEHSSFLRDIKLSEIVARCEEKLSDGTLEDGTNSYLQQGKNDSWPEIRKLLWKEIEGVTLMFHNSISELKLDINEAICKDKQQQLEDYGKRIVEKAARDTGKRVLVYMKDRFNELFVGSRVWNGDEDMDKIVNNAARECVKLLSVVAVIRLDEQPDDIESRLVSSFLPINKSVVSSDEDLDSTFFSFLRRDSTPWDKVSRDYTIITPLECTKIWKKFLYNIRKIITQAMDTLRTRNELAAAKLERGAGGVLNAIDTFINALMMILENFFN